MHSGAAFQSTNWSMVLAAHEDPRLLDALIRRYLAPIYAYIRRAGRPRDEAADLTQEFVAQILLERGLFDRADAARGRFRTFIKSALSHFLVDQHRRATARADAAGPWAAPARPRKTVAALRKEAGRRIRARLSGRDSAAGEPPVDFVLSRYPD